MTLQSALGLGLLLGMRHATDADHLVVVTTLLARGAGVRAAVRTAGFWSLGHTFTLLVAGVLIVVAGVRLPAGADRLAELLVALMLVVVGGTHFARRERRETQDPSTPSRARPLVIGLVHGLAGSAGVVLVALTTIPTAAGALGFLLLFAAGTVLGMSAVTTALSYALQTASARTCRAPRLVTAVASMASVVLGLMLGWGALLGARNAPP